MNDLGLHFEIKRLRAEVRKLQCENSALRALTGRRKRLAVKVAVIKMLEADPSTPSSTVATRAKCTVRYVNQLKRELFPV